MSARSPRRLSVLHRLATLAVRSRRAAVLTVVGWLVLATAVASIAPRLKDVEENRGVNDPPAAAQSMQARALAARAFGERGTPAVIVLHDPAGLGARGEAELRRIVGALAAPRLSGRIAPPVSPLTSAAASRALRSRDGTTAQIVVPVLGHSAEDAFGETVDAIRHVAGRGGRGLDVSVTGPAAVARDAVKAFGSADLALLGATVLIVLVLMLAIYRSPALAVVPLLAVGVALEVTNAAGAALVDLGAFSISSQAASIMTVLLFGVGTDYCLFVVSRYREELGEQPDRWLAMQAAMRRMATPLVSSAATVVLALLALLLATLPALRGFGPYLALAVLVMVLAALTFVPALVCLLGRAALWPRRFARSGESRLWRAVADRVVRRPRAAALAATGVLALLALGLTQQRESYDLISGFRVPTESAHGRALLERAFPPGALAPATVLVADPAAAASRPELARVRAAVRAVPGVVRVSPVELAPAGGVARLQVVQADDPYGSAAMDRTGRLRDAAAAALHGTALRDARVLVGGESAKSLDLRHANDRDLRVVAPVVMGVILLVLVVLLRSLVAPLYLVASIVLSYAATMGLTVTALLTLGGDDGIGVRVAIYAFVFLVALGVDYNILLMSRIREEAGRLGHAAGVHRALVRTGGVISSAGLILAGTFAVLMTQPVRELFQFGFAMAAGLLLDTFLVRGMLVPAVTTLLGERAWWPGGRARHARPRDRSLAPVPLDS